MIFAYRSHAAQRKFNDSFDHIPLNVLLHLGQNSDATFDLQPWQDLDQGLRLRLNNPMPKAWGPLIGVDVAADDLISWKLSMQDPGQFEVPRPWTEVELEVYALARTDLARRKLLEEQNQVVINWPLTAGGF